jgi:shikimate kinase
MSNKNNIFLIGFMGSGKTTLGKKLAKKLAQPFFDLDQEIEKSTGLTIGELFDQYGEPHFRDVESKILQSLILKNEHFVLSLGGGTPCSQGNMCLIKRAGTAIYLKYNAGILASRLKDGKAKRPLIKDFNESQLKDFITNKLMEREPFYNQAQLVLESNNIRVEDLLRILAKD